MNDRRPLLAVDKLSRHFIIGGGIFQRSAVLHAVSGVAFDLHRGETIGIVGESGSGKSTLGKVLVGLYRPTSGDALYDGISVLSQQPADRSRLNREIQMVFQDPYSSLNPRKRISQILSVPLRVHTDLSPNQRKARVAELLTLVGLDESFAKRFPHQLSGGQRQRVGIARGLSLDPSLLILDEPIASLDVSVQAQIVNLLGDLQARLSLTIIFIAHDLNMVRHISTHVGVMYLGRLVELGAREKVFSSPAHPYTRALISAAPIADPQQERSRDRVVLRGEIPSPISPPTGCVFHTRCPIMQPICKEREPNLATKSIGQKAACHFPYELAESDRSDAH